MGQLALLGAPVLLPCAYAPSGHEREQEQREFMRDLHSDIVAQNTFCCVIGGDYNTYPVDTSLAGQLIEAGIGVPACMT